MKITRVEATATAEPHPHPHQDALQWLDTRGLCRITVESDDGVSGRSTTYFGQVDQAPAVLAHLVNDILGPAILGEDPFLIRGVRDRLWKLTAYHGSHGRALFGIAGIDIALWDLMGRALEQPVWRLLGAQLQHSLCFARRWGASASAGRAAQHHVHGERFAARRVTDSPGGRLLSAA